MSNPFHTLAVMAKQQNPNDARSLDELEAYFRNLQSASPLARAVQAECAALDQEMTDAEERADMVSHAEQCIDAWKAARTMPESRADLVEYLEAQLESNFPDVSDEAIRSVVRQVTREPSPFRAFAAETFLPTFGGTR